MIPGKATREGTLRFKNRFVIGEAAAVPYQLSHFRDRAGLWFSSVGIGSYLGNADEATDKQYMAALKEAVKLGVNVLDCAINYRAQRSERSFGKALAQLIQAEIVKRDEIIVCTKGGFLPFDGAVPSDGQAYLKSEYVDKGRLRPEDIAQGCHAMTPEFLEDQLARSLENLGLETIDVYYVHNPETQLAEVERKVFLDRMRAVFEWMEKKVAEGKIQVYGAATWNGFRQDQSGGEFLSLEELNVLAREAAGPAHHFKAVQLPVNLAMPEAWVYPNQPYGGNVLPFLRVADHLGFATMASASLLQARLTGPFPDFLQAYFKNLKASSQRAIQFTRSLPGVTTALVGMKNVAHVRENLEVAKVKSFGEEELVSMFSKER